MDNQSSKYQELLVKYQELQAEHAKLRQHIDEPIEKISKLQYQLKLNKRSLTDALMASAEKGLRIIDLLEDLNTAKDMYQTKVKQLELQEQIAERYSTMAQRLQKELQTAIQTIAGLEQKIIHLQEVIDNAHLSDLSSRRQRPSEF